MLTMDFVSLIWLQLGFMLLALIWKFDFPPFMVLIIAILNDGVFFFLLDIFLLPAGEFPLSICVHLFITVPKKETFMRTNMELARIRTCLFFVLRLQIL